ncbi:hypothetical protein LLG95_10155 [bacterium]|nr:hypothetical protein [bacterium]
MKKLSLLICLGILLAGQSWATTYHVFKTATNVSPNFDNLTSAVQAVNAGTGGDTISIDDSSTYSLSATLTIAQNDTSIVAASSQSPVIQSLLGTSGSFCLGITKPGFRLGSIAGGTITLDGNKTARRFINQSNTDAAWAAYGASTNTYENLIVKNMGTNTVCTSNYVFWILSDDGTSVVPVGTVVNFKYIDFQWLPGKPTVTIGAGAAYIGIRVHPTNIATINIENCRSNTLTGYVVSASNETADRPTQCGIVNIKNCRFVYDDPTMTNYRQMGSPVAIWGGGSTNNINGYVMNIDNSYLRSDATNNGIWSPTHISPALTAGTRDTSEALGALFLANYQKNNVTITNSAFVAKGAGIEINSAHAHVGLFNSDIYVPAAGQYTQGYFISVAERSAVATSADLQCSATRCNFYGVKGSRINSGPRGAGSVFSMTTCNDWSPENAYASNWVTASCVNPGLNPGYGAMAGEADPMPAINARDFTVYNNTIKSQNIGSNRDFNFGVPVELSTFGVR